MILVYSENCSTRLRYALRLMFEDVLQCGFELTADAAVFEAYDGPKISYASKPQGGEINFRPCGLLEETGIKQQDIEMFMWDDIPVFFRVKEGACPCDPFSMAFYLAVRYEEYLVTVKDEYGRFPAEASLASRAGFLNKPVINLLALKIREMILREFSSADLPLPKFEFRPSVDIDIAYAHLEKGWPRAAGGFAKLLLKGKFSVLKERFNTLRGSIPDPYDNFDYQLDVFDKLGFKPVYFVLLGDYGRYDKNISYRSARFRKLIWKLAEHADVGIHPSYDSFNEPGKIGREIERLERIIRKPVTLSRQHFLRLSFPETYRILIEKGITDDHSLGFSSCNGFRAGLCSAYSFYDLEKEEITNLRLHPFIFMDTAMIDNMGYLPGQGVEETGSLMEQVKKTGGTAIGVWHNYALSETEQYKGWRESFVQSLNLASKLEAGQ